MSERRLALTAVGHLAPMELSDEKPGTNGALLIEIIRREYLRQGATECSDLRLTMKEHGQFIKGLVAGKVVHAPRLYALLENSNYVVVKIAEDLVDKDK